jgi:methionyl-tRNA synthetase
VWAQLGLGDIEQAAREGKLKDLQWGGLQPGTKLGPLSPIFPRADKGLAQIMTDMENNNAAPSGTSTETTKPSFDPAAPPRTSSLESLDEPSGVLPVAGSGATTTRSGLTPSHTVAVPSGPFASVASQTPVNAAASDSSTQITIDDFAKVELRVAQIVVAERIPKADKLLRLEVDLGPEMPKRQILSGIAEWYAPEELIGRRIVVITNLAPRKMRGLESHGMLLAASNGENGKPVLATFGEDIALGSRLK